MKKKKHNKKKKASFLKRIKNNIGKSFSFVSNNYLENEDSDFSISEVIVVIIIAISFGIFIGYVITYSKYQVGSDAKVAEIVSTYDNIIKDYYDKVDRNDLADAAIKGMINSLNDPYSNFIDSDVADAFNETIDGEFVGIGVSIQYDMEKEYNKVIDYLNDSPSKKVGIEIGDYIIKVNGEDVKGLYGDNITKKVKGKIGTKVKITVLRGDKELDYVITRGNIEIDSVTSKIADEDSKIGYISISSFAANTYKQFSSKLLKLEKKGINSLIIDVRDNPGGHLNKTRDILSLFFNKKTVLYQIENKGKVKKIYSTSDEVRSYPVVILMNKGSASASEILATCFKDNYKKVKLVGLTSYGKGTVQNSQSLSTGSSIKYTTEKWLTSKGKWLNEKGLKPDLEVSLNDEFYSDPKFENDNQIHEAIKLLKESNFE
ncbi:MAG: S41 family peptidase [Bacilli bacterium]|nr:S41 family peptidase [Bacilli bacterium]MBR1936075.1 S41 family peptidase [Bacilli bacterium]